jgi:uncharacterized protein
MRGSVLNKRKIFNDPVYGFISIPDELIFDIIEHKYFQRLRRIKQLGLTHLVYPGALHTRFQHSLGAMHLMMRAINELKFKGLEINDEEALGVCIAILLHDIGHGPYSHALEHSIVEGISHEQISRIFIERLNAIFNGKLDLALSIFNGDYKKMFLNKLVSGQFDMDRLDYLKRDSFFTGVSEGIVNYERLLNMINVVDDNLVIDAKGIYSVEKFIAARRLMYWQVYLHKTVLVAEFTIMKVLKRAKFLSLQGVELFATPALEFFLRNEITISEFENNNMVIDNFTNLDDFDIFTSMKVWTTHSDPILSRLSSNIVNRRLSRIELQNKPFDEELVEDIKSQTMLKLNLNRDEIDYFVIVDQTSNFTYKIGTDKIGILYKDGRVEDIAEASDQLNISLLSKPTTKYFLCYPKEIN